MGPIHGLAVTPDETELEMGAGGGGGGDAAKPADKPEGDADPKAAPPKAAPPKDGPGEPSK